MNQETKWKCSLLLMGILLLILLLPLGRRGRESTKEDKLAQEEKKEENAQEEKEAEPVPIPEYNGRIRVLMKNNEYAGLYHEKLEIGLGDESWCFTKDDDTYYLNEEPLKEENFPVELQEHAGQRYTIASLERAYGNPALEGRLEIYGTDRGFVLVNELPLEDYLKYVVPSEMPASYELEALKAQAVCARTYAYSQMQTYAYPDYLAHVDDSVTFQVYQNLDAAKQSTQAVAETAGQILSYEGQVITAYYFSTSFGHTSNQEVWWEGDAALTPYLQGKCTDETGESLDLTTEEAFGEFLQEQRDGYDSAISWYRWNTSIDVETLSEHLNAGLKSRYEANPEAVLTKKAGKFVSAPIKTIGTIKKIEVLERGEGGVLNKIQVTGTKRTIQILTEYNIRALLNVQGETIYRQDGSEVEGGSLLPSGYFVIAPEYQEQKLTGFTFEGGGYGHGVGMSQNGANQMAKEGKSWEEILKFFYTGVELTSLAGLS